MAVLKYKNGEGQFVTLTNYTVQPITPVQTTGDSLTDIMSQKAVSDEVNKKVNEAELGGKIADAISGNPTVKNAIADVIGDDAVISGAVEDIAEGAADAKIAAYDAVAEGKFAAKDHNHDGVYAPLSHTHNVTDINNFSDEVADAVKTEIANNNSAITESIENVVEKYIYGGDAPSSATVITTENMETELGDYAKKTDIPTVVSAFENDAEYVTSGAVSAIVETSIAENEAVQKAIADAIADDDSIKQAIEDAVAGELEKKADTSAVTASINAATSGKMDTDSFNTYSGAVETILGNKADTSAVTASIEAATSGKVDTTVFNTYSGEVQTELNSKFDGVSYDSNTKKIEFKNGERVLAEIDATDFIKDGMVDNVEISGSNLVVTFNTDAGKEAISIALTDIFDPSNYYNKTEADGKFLTISSAETLYVANDDFDNKVKGVLDDSAEVSGSVVDIIENYITGASSNIYTKEEANGAFQEKGDYVSAATFNNYTGTTVPSLLDEKADVEHTHYASAVTDFASAVAESVSGNASVSGAVEEIVNDKLDGYYTKDETDSAISSAITAASGVTPTIVEGMIESALTEATFESSQISDLADAVSGLVANNTDVKNEIIKEVTESTIFTTLSGDVYTISGDVVALSGEVSGKQDALVSGDNIKTVNGESLLGSGNVDIIDQTLDSGSTKAIANSAITIALIENEKVVSSALNDLNDRILTHSGNTDIHVTAADKTAWNGKLDASALNDYYTKSETDSAIASAITAASGVTPTIVGEMIESALTEATFESSAITDFASAVSGLVANNTDVKNEIIKEVTESTIFTTLSGDVYTISGDVVALSGTATAAKAVTDFYVGHNSVSSLANLPNTKRLVIAAINGSSNELSVSGNSLADGYEIHVIVANNGSADITVTLPTSANYVSIGETITIKANSTGEINIISDGTTLYVRGA